MNTEYMDVGGFSANDGREGSNTPWPLRSYSHEKLHAAIESIPEGRLRAAVLKVIRTAPELLPKVLDSLTSGVTEPFKEGMSVEKKTDEDLNTTDDEEPDEEYNFSEKNNAEEEDEEDEWKGEEEDDEDKDKDEYSGSSDEDEDENENEDIPGCETCGLIKTKWGTRFCLGYREEDEENVPMHQAGFSMEHGHLSVKERRRRSHTLEKYTVSIYDTPTTRYYQVGEGILFIVG